MNYKVVECKHPSKPDRTVRLFRGPYDNFGDAIHRAYQIAAGNKYIYVAVISENNELCFLVEGKDHIPHIYNLPEIEVTP